MDQLSEPDPVFPAKKPRLVALKAVAHKLARAGFYLLRDGGRFEVHRAFA